MTDRSSSYLGCSRPSGGGRRRNARDGRAADAASLPATVFCISDLHAEMYDGVVPYERFLPAYDPDITVIAGDLCPATLQVKFIAALEGATRRSGLTLFVAGNHEYYTDPYNVNPALAKRMNEVDAFIEDSCRRVGGDRIVFLREGVDYRLRDTLFVGATLWADVPRGLWPEARASVSDYSMVLCDDGQLMSPARQVELHIRAKAHIANSVEYARQNGIPNVVCVTHHVPSAHLFPRYAGAIQRVREGADGSLLPSYNYYCTDMQDIVEAPDSPIRLWCCGHDHCSRLQRLSTRLSRSTGFWDRVRSSARPSLDAAGWSAAASNVPDCQGPLFASNAVGYPSEPNPAFDRRFLIPLAV